MLQREFPLEKSIFVNMRIGSENKLFTKMRQFVKGDAGELDNKDREPDEPEVKT